MTEELLQHSADGPVAIVTLNRPAARNALSLAMITALDQTVQTLGTDTETKVMVLRANGPAFCAGHDLKELTAARESADKGIGFFRETMQACAALMQRIVSCPKPIIAEVHGIATAAGCQLVATADLAVAAEGAASFATPGVDIGLFCSTPMVALTRNVSRKTSMEMLLTGQMVDADTAKSIGLVNRVVPAEALSRETMSLAQSIASKSPKTLAIGKEAFYRQVELPLSAAYEYTAEVMVTNMMERDAQEGIGAFLEKRTPTWE